MNPQISVIVPCYNYGHYLAQTLRNVREQTFGDWECIVVDDGSTDNSAEVARRFVESDARFGLIETPNGGLSAARNCGVQAARGAWIQFLDADDLMDARKLATHWNFARAHPDCAVVCGPWRYFGGDVPDKSAPAPLGHLEMAPAVTPDFERLLRRNLFVVHASLVKREVALLGFDPLLRSQEDWDLWLRAAHAGHEFCSCPDRAGEVWVRVHPDSMSYQRERTYRALVRVRDKIAQLPLAPPLLELNRALRDDARAGLAIHLAKHGELGRGTRGLWHLARTSHPRYALWALALPFVVTATRFKYGQNLVRQLRRVLAKPL